MEWRLTSRPFVRLLSINEHIVTPGVPSPSTKLSCGYYFLARQLDGLRRGTINGAFPLDRDERQRYSVLQPGKRYTSCVRLRSSRLRRLGKNTSTSCAGSLSASSVTSGRIRCKSMIYV